MPSEQLIESSEWVVEATYIGTTTVQINATSVSLGMLHINHVHKGHTPAKLLTIQVPTPKTSQIVSTDLHYKVGQHGIWSLTRQRNGLLTANHPQRYQTLNNASSLLQTLKSASDSP